MSFSIGIWRCSEMSSGVIYRWEADAGAKGTGFLLLDPTTGTIRPCGSDGIVVGTLTMDTKSGSLTGATPGIDRATFARTAAAIYKSLLSSGTPPETAHAYFG